MTFRVGWVDDRELGYRALVLHEDSVGETLEVQAGSRSGDGDGASTLEDYCLVRNGAAVVYGGVESFGLSRASLTVALTPEAADVLALPLVVPYDLDDDGLGLVRQRLSEICPDVVREGCWSGTSRVGPDSA